MEKLCLRTCSRQKELNLKNLDMTGPVRNSLLSLASITGSRSTSLRITISLYLMLIGAISSRYQLDQLMTESKTIMKLWTIEEECHPNTLKRIKVMTFLELLATSLQDLLNLSGTRTKEWVQENYQTMDCKLCKTPLLHSQENKSNLKKSLLKKINITSTVQRKKVMSLTSRSSTTNRLT